MSIDNTAHLILGLPDKGKFVHREMIWEAGWIDTNIATYADLKAIANLWLTAQDVLPTLRKCWSQNADDAHFDSEAFELIGKLREALEKE